MVCRDVECGGKQAGDFLWAINGFVKYCESSVCASDI